MVWTVEISARFLPVTELASARTALIPPGVVARNAFNGLIGVRNLLKFNRFRVSPVCGRA
jgi:hypothetical protein